MGVHARLSASSAHRWMVCAGSVALSEAAAFGSAPPSSLAAAQGTVAHKIASEVLLGRGRMAVGVEVQEDGHVVEITQEMLNAVEVYVDFVRSISVPRDGTIWIEMSVFKGLQKIDKDLGGTADFVCYDQNLKHLHVVDFKHGSGVYVGEEANPQLMLYGLGAALELALPIREITLTICQPRFEGAPPVRSWTFPIQHALDFIRDVAVRASLTRAVGAPLTPGDHCKFCPAARICPELERKHHELTAQSFALPVGEMLTRALRSLGPLKERIKAIEEHAYAEACRGVEIPGFKLVDKRPVRRWIREADVIEWAQTANVDPYAPREVLSPAQMEKRAGKSFKTPLAALIKSESSGTALVPIEDNRPAVTKVSIQDFPVIEGTVEKKEAVPLSLLP